MSPNSRLATPEEKAENTKALDRLLVMYPTLTEDKVGEFLINATAYPFNSLTEAVAQAAEYAVASGGDWERATRLSMEEFDRIWEEGRPERDRLQREEEERQKAENEKWVELIKARRAAQGLSNEEIKVTFTNDETTSK